MPLLIALLMQTNIRFFHTFDVVVCRPAGNAKELIEVAVHSVRAIPTPSSATTTTTSSLDTELYLALLRSNQAVAINLKGETVKVYSPPGMHRADDFAATGGVGSAKKSNNLRASGNDFVAATFSAQGTPSIQSLIANSDLMNFRQVAVLCR